MGKVTFRSIIRATGTLLGVAVFCTAAFGEKPPPPQYVNISPLPGSGIALNSDGKPDGYGAMQINIPVAFTPGKDYVELSAYVGQFVNSNKDKPEWNNGTGVLGMGFGTWPHFYGSAMAVSSLIRTDSKVVSAQLQVTKESERTPAIAFGAQDILDKESHDFGSKYSTGVSYYGVATKALPIAGKNAYLTLGYGSARFLNRPFGGVSVPVNDHISLATEYDGFQLNTAVGWRPWGRYSHSTLLGGYNSQAGWVIGTRTTGKLNNLWALPIFILLLRP